MKIKIIITGGILIRNMMNLPAGYFSRIHTFRKDEAWCIADLDIATLMMMDSLYMTDEQRHLIASYCKNAKEKNILITHGTDTMAETTKYFSKQVSNKIIVLTGAMVPYKFGSSDGLFNLGSAPLRAGNFTGRICCHEQ